MGYLTFLETLLRTGGVISYGNPNNNQDLSNYKVFIVTETKHPIYDGRKDAIINFVKNGGGLYMIADHDNSDRKWEVTVGILQPFGNDLVSTNSVVANPFGITFDVTFHKPLLILRIFRLILF